MLVPGCVVLDIRDAGSRRADDPEGAEGAAARPAGDRRSGEARGNVDVGVQAMKAGAVDFLDVPYRCRATPGRGRLGPGQDP